jgi:hypothetical protein
MIQEKIHEERKNEEINRWFIQVASCLFKKK